MQKFFFPGQIVAVKKAGIIEHEGVVVHNNNVVHNSPHHGGVILSSMDIFSSGQEIIASDKYVPKNSSAYIVSAAYASVGKKKWWPWYNCQHFISEIAGLRPRSRQLAQVMPFLALFFLAVGLSRR